MSGAYGFDPERFVRRNGPPAPVVPLRPVPSDWEHGLRLLADRVVPRGATSQRWEQIVADATTLATRFQAGIRRAGWDVANVFGYDPNEPAGLVGLAVRMRGRLLIDIDADQAILKTANGYAYHRPLMRADAPLLWNFKESGGAQ